MHSISTRASSARPLTATAVRAVSEVQARQAMAKGGQGATDIQVVERVPTPPPTGAGQAAYMFVRTRIGGPRCKQPYDADEETLRSIHRVAFDELTLAI